MKVQEVVLRAMAGKLQWWQAAEILGVCLIKTVPSVQKQMDAAPANNLF